MESSWGCSSELSLAGPCGGSARAAALQGWVENQQSRKAQAAAGGRMEEANPRGVSGLCCLP